MFEHRTLSWSVFKPSAGVLVALVLTATPLAAQDDAQDDDRPGSLVVAPDDTGDGGPPEFHNPSARSYPFPAKGKDLPDGVYWRVTGHDAPSTHRDMSAARFDASSGTWSGVYPSSTGLSGDARALIWNVPVYAPAAGLVLGCWRVAKDGDDPLEANCGDGAAGPCRRPGGGNHVRIWIPDENRLFFLAHFQENSVPERLCTHGRTEMADTTDDTGAFGMTPELANLWPFPQVAEGEYLGRVGNSGRSGGPHLHIDLRECDTPLRNIADDCSSIPMRFTDADITEQPSGRDVREDDWVSLNGPLPVTSPVRLVRPDAGIGGFVPRANVTAAMQTVPDVTVVLDVTNSASPVNAFDWVITSPITDRVFDFELTADVVIDGNCPGGVETLEVTTPTGTTVQSFPTSSEVVALTDAFVAFDREEVSEFCLDFAASQSGSELCSQAPEQCDSLYSTEFVGGVDGPGSVVTARMSCHNGTVIEREIQPRMDLRCGLVPFGALE